jgi:hypothetical protein
VLEKEREEWIQPLSSNHHLNDKQLLLVERLTNFSNTLCSNPATDSTCLALESATYTLFSRIMTELEPLYSPLLTGPPSDQQPSIVHFCIRIQEHLLRGLDPTLSTHLEECFIQAQLYGMRWSRLLLGREFELKEETLLRIWDYMFGCCMEKALRDKEKEEEGKSSSPYAHEMLRKKSKKNKDTGKDRDIDILTKHTKSSSSVLPFDPLSGVLYEEENWRLKGGPDSDDSESEESDSDDDILWTTSSAIMKAGARTGSSSPLLDALSDFMLAMLLQVNQCILFVTTVSRFEKISSQEIHHPLCSY